MIKYFVKTHSDFFKTIISIYHLVSILTFMAFNAFRDTVSILSLVTLFIGEITVFYLLYIMSYYESDTWDLSYTNITIESHVNKLLTLSSDTSGISHWFLKNKHIINAISEKITVYAQSHVL